jgi:hypothetical protein
MLRARSHDTATAVARIWHRHPLKQAVQPAVDAPHSWNSSAHQPGLTNTELARGGFLSRQAMHQLLATLKSLDLVHGDGGGRHEHLTLTDDGARRRHRCRRPSKNACSPRSTLNNDNASTLTSPPAPKQSTGSPKRRRKGVKPLPSAAPATAGELRGHQWE